MPVLVQEHIVPGVNRARSKSLNKSTRQRLFSLGRLALGVALLAALLVVNDNGRKVLDAFVQVQPIYLIPFFAITYPLLGASCMK